MKRLVCSHTEPSAECFTQVGKTARNAWAEELWRARRMGVVPLTRCQPQPVARHRGSAQAWKNDTFFTSRICFTYVTGSQQPQKGRFLAGRKLARTINRVSLTCSPDRFSPTCILSALGILILHLCEAYKNIWLAQTEFGAMFPVPPGGL